jgi:hypothetical protein
MYSVTVNADTFITCVGVCYSNNFPVTAGCYQPTYSASGDGFVARYKLSETWTPNEVLENSIFENSIMVYPNPAASDVHVRSISTIEKISVFSLEGKLIDCDVQITGNAATINTSDLNAGVYSLAITTANGVSQEKLVIAR